MLHSLARNAFCLALVGMLAACASTSQSTVLSTSSPQYGQWNTGAGEANEPSGGEPPKGAMPSVQDFDYQAKYQAAFQVMLWSRPAAAIYRPWAASKSQLQIDDTTVITYDRVATPRLEAITANSSTPYIFALPDLRKGPVVVDVPPSGPDGSLYGQVVDAWQLTIADIGPGGKDDGKGGKYLFTPPGYQGEIPAGYIHVASPNYRIAFAFRSIVAPGKTAQDAVNYARRLRVYHFQDANSPPPEQKFMVADERVFSTLPYYDERAFDDIYQIFSVEPARPQDKTMMGMLATLGIVQGQPFNPDETTKKAMRQAAIDSWYYLQYWFDHVPADQLYWPDRHYVSLLMADKSRTFTWDYTDRIDYTARAAEYFWCTFMPHVLSDSPSTQYMMATADNQGQPLLAGKTYKLNVPADMPVKQFWALTVYDRATMAFIYTPSSRTTLSSYDLDKMKKNADGSVSLYVGPKAPDGLESNWIPTNGKRPLPAMRFYGPTQPMNEKTFKLPDFERVD
ncbi:DUF1214 domain-containing protein [Silvimonas amylolytica]|uniref:DUF1254 domain-containing protein n=1 Tax=Silvimonas amylolytica TaxID=449663 RepID=A0ABQ2PIA5_9NEIS|nr:DUF1214 domain-containing protein [Silvimonas amylolytica]GGP25310.1 hypothetical protein GCM10010971_11290 [Silvimonas amylolytica]